jgi:signal peptidase I
MFGFLQPKFIQTAEIYRREAGKRLRYNRDIWPEKAINGFEQAIAALKRGIAARDKEGLETTQKELESLASEFCPVPKDAAIRENVEVFVTAIIIAIGIRTFLLQPFTIPTGSMQPTLNGITGTWMAQNPPNYLARWWDYVWQGRTYVHVVAKEDDMIVRMQPENNLFGLFNQFQFKHTRLFGARGSYLVPAPPDVVQKVFGLNVYPGDGISLLSPLAVRKGEAILRGYYDQGDFVFVDRVSYNFARPNRGDVIVFHTRGLPTKEGAPYQEWMFGPSQFYIKRLAGLPGDTLRVDSGKLIVNGKPAEGAAFQRVMSARDGYNGYANGAPRNILPFDLRTADKSFTIPNGRYYAMGDNSYNSSDSRYWGPFPETNTVGRGVFVLWPFSRHFGFVK